MVVVKYKAWFLGVSTALVVASIVAVGLFGLREGIDFTGGTAWQLQFSKAISGNAVANILNANTGINATVTMSADGLTAFIRTETLSEGDHQALRAALEKKLGSVTEQSFQSIGPSIGKSIRQNAIIAIAMVLVGISLYVAFVFRKASRSASSWTYGITTLITLFHDVSIPIGLFTILGRWKGVEIDTNFLVALLVVAGFSVHDTIVVFDRIRENSMAPGSEAQPLAVIIGKSISETFTRSINTSLTLVFMLVALLFFGPQTLFYFTLTILVGVIAGAYSSICVASPLILIWKRKDRL